MTIPVHHIIRQMYIKSKYESESIYLSFCNLCILKQVYSVIVYTCVYD